MNDNEIVKSNRANQSQSPSHFVGIGASAGGLEAIQELVSNMRSDAGLAYIIVQHLSPDYKSLMAELLAKYTEMPIVRIEDGMQVKKDTIYLISPRKNIKIFHGKLISVDQEGRHKGQLNLPIDILFQSMAEDIGDKAIGIVLSGTGSDGTRGIRAIKESGGMTVAQLPETAKFDSMPESAISTGLVDFILSPDVIPQQLNSYVKHPFARHSEQPFIPETDNGLARIFSLLRDRHKVDFTHYKPSTIIRRIERRITINQCQSLDEYKAFIDQHPKEITTLFQELLIGVTSFFRDELVYDAIADDVIPELFAPYKDVKQTEEFRVWVAGCSSGEEAYSMAMLCHDYIEKHKLKIKVKIFATDVDSTAIEKASIGIYSNSIAADVSPEHLTKYFINRDEHYQINREIRECVVFAQHDLTRDPPFTNIDLITCRNLMIYLQPVLQKKVLELFNFSLKSSGILVLGSSETIGDCEDLYEVINSKLKIFRTKGKRALTNFTHNVNVSGSVKRYSSAVSSVARESESLMRFSEERFYDRFIQSLSQHDVLPLTLVADERMSVSHIYGDSEDFLRYTHGKVVLELGKIVIKELSIPVTTALQKSIKTQQSISLTNIKVRRDMSQQMVEVQIIPMRGRGNQESIYAVLIKEEQRTGDESNLGTNYNVGLDAEQRIADLEQELQFSRESLQATVEELETSNEELQATNEELLASNEELQSTNEELQSVNEELYTVNAEYQSKITELTTLNTDMDNLFESTSTAALFLDENAEIRRFTPKLATIFPVIQTDIGRSISHLVINIGNNVDLTRLVKNVMRDEVAQEHEFVTKDGKWHLLRVTPYKVSHNIRAGVVLTVIDIDDLKHAQKGLLEQTQTQAERLLKIIESSDDAFVQYRPDGKILIWSKGAQALYGWSEKEALEMSVYDMLESASRSALQSAFESLADSLSSHVTINKLHKNGQVLTVQLSLRADNDVSDNMILTSKESLAISTNSPLDVYLADMIRSNALANKPMILLDELGVITHLNESMLEMTSWREEKVLGKTIFDVLSIESKERFVDIQQFIAGTTDSMECDIELQKTRKATLSMKMMAYKLGRSLPKQYILLTAN